MTKGQRKSSARGALTFAEASRSFVGHLEGTEKALLTIRNYRSDLRSFEEFLRTGLANRPVALQQVHPRDLTRYSDYLTAQNFRSNTRRRKVLTIRKFLAYLGRRNKIAPDLAART